MDQQTIVPHICQRWRKSRGESSDHVCHFVFVDMFYLKGTDGFVCRPHFDAQFLSCVFLFGYRWNQEEAVISLIRKAGFYGEICSNLLCRVQCTRYQSSKRRLTWSEYCMLQGRDPLDGLVHQASSLSSNNHGVVETSGAVDGGKSSPGGGGGGGGRPQRCPFFPW